MPQGPGSENCSDFIYFSLSSNKISFILINPELFHLPLFNNSLCYEKKESGDDENEAKMEF